MGHPHVPGFHIGEQGKSNQLSTLSQLMLCEINMVAWFQKKKNSQPEHLFLSCLQKLKLERGVWTSITDWKESLF